MTNYLKEIYHKFPKEEDAIKFLENIVWQNTPVCPYCRTSFFSRIKDSRRYHCNKCNTSFSVTVGTLFHRSKVDLRKWFYCLAVAGEADDSLRTMATHLDVTKDTISKMIKRIRCGYLENQKIITEILNKII